MLQILKGKKILLGVCGSIAAYKSALIVRLLVKAEAEVKVIMTEDATEFITPLTLSTLSKNEVLTHFIKKEGGLWNNHVELGLWADVFLIAPASANTLGKMANGICDNLLLATYLSAKCKVIVAPAMDLDMWKHPSTQKNIEVLESYGNEMIPVGSGELASGLSGEGRLAEPEEIVTFLSDFFNKNSEKNFSLKGKKIMISAGPTYEPIDPVRFIGNRSSGKMGIALADEAANLGAKVYLVLGPSKLLPKNENVEVTKVKTAADMLKICLKLFPEVDVAIMAAAVSDYTPVNVSDKKIKKKTGELTLYLTKTTDILKTLGQQKQPNQTLVGFALETNNEEKNALKKLESKNLDFIVLNSLQEKGAGFAHDTNKITIYDKHNNIKKYQLKSKKAVALDILEYLYQYSKKF